MCVELKSKLDQYGIEIYDNYVVEEEEVYNHCENMIIIYNRKDNNYAVSFEASSKPEYVGNMMIILNQLTKPIEIIESYTYNSSNVPVFGDDAHNIINNSIKEKIEKDVEKENFLQNLLTNIDPDEFFKC